MREKGVEKSLVYSLISQAAQRGAQDLYIGRDSPPFVRIRDHLARLSSEIIRYSDIEDFFTETASPLQQESFSRTGWTRYALSMNNEIRCRIDVFSERAGPSLFLRLLPQTTPSFDTFHYPERAQELLFDGTGIFVVSGKPSSGRTTLISSFIESVNETRTLRITEVSDVAEYIHESKASFISQMEMRGEKDYTPGILRTLPDLLVIDAGPDSDFVRLAVMASENGTKVVLSIEGQNAASALEAMVTLMPVPEREEWRTRLSRVLEAVVCQKLLWSKSGSGLVATEVLVATPPVRSLLREGKFREIGETILTGQKHGMQTMEKSLLDLRQKGLV